MNYTAVKLCVAVCLSVVQRIVSTLATLQCSMLFVKYATQCV